MLISKYFLTLYSMNSYRSCSLLITDLAIFNLSKIFHSISLPNLGYAFFRSIDKLVAVHCCLLVDSDHLVHSVILLNLPEYV